MKDSFRCVDCHTVLPVPRYPESGGTGYATVGKARRKVCYACCAKRDRRFMLRHGRISLYLTQDPQTNFIVTNWPGTLRFPVTSAHRSHLYIPGTWFAYYRWDVRFTGPDGATWYGRAQGNSELCHCKRMRGGKE